MALKENLNKPASTWFKRSKLAGQHFRTAVFILFPFVFSLITGTPVNEGANKYWQGQLIAFFILAVYAMSYDLLMGYTGILSFGHAAFFGGGAYAMALFLNMWARRFWPNMW